jgi:hypothetical protein
MTARQVMKEIAAMTPDERGQVADSCANWKAR